MAETIPDDLRLLLSKPVLWPEEVRRVKRLAHLHRIAVRIERRELDHWEAGWRQVDTIEDEQG